MTETAKGAARISWLLTLAAGFAFQGSGWREIKQRKEEAERLKEKAQVPVLILPLEK